MGSLEERKGEDEIKMNIRPEHLEDFWFKFGGYGWSQTRLYTAYRLLMLCPHYFMVVMCAYAVPFVMEDLFIGIEALHWTMAADWVFSTSVLRLLADRCLRVMKDLVESGIFHYRDEPVLREQAQIREDLLRRFRRDILVYISVNAASFLVAYFVSPILEYSASGCEPPAGAVHFFNPCLPHVFYWPLETRGAGFWPAYLADIGTYVFITLATVNTVRIYVFYMVQLELHLKLLNSSLENIERRAVCLYERRFGVDRMGAPVKALYERKDFQECLQACLRSNIQHHQALLRYKDAFQPFMGPSLLMIFAVIVALIYAAVLYLFLQEEPFRVRLKYFLILSAEQTGTVFLIIMGEKIITESNITFDKLYGTPWMDCSKNFRQTLHIMMSYTRKPIVYRAWFVDATASHESYGQLIKTTYTFTNVMNNMK